tara:strand:+ start:111177 stop:111719 length:543 start_codon:yes stop_codon:yes gene_type:complete
MDLEFYLEMLGFISLLLSVYYIGKESTKGWSIGIISCIAFGALFLNNGLYGLAILQGVFIIQSLYGWYNWDKNIIVLPVSKLGIRKFSGQFIFVACISILVVMKTDLIPLDVIITCLSLLATWFLAKKYLEAWYVWILVDILSIYLFYQSELYVISGLHIIVLGLAINGLIKWRKSLKTH